MTALDVTAQLAAIGAGQVASAVPAALLWALAVIFGPGCLLAAWWLVSWRKELRRVWREQHPKRDAADAALDDWVAAGVITSGDRADLDREIDDMIRKYGG